MDSQRPYPVEFFNEIHAYFPAILYEPERFRDVGELLSYIITQVRSHSDPFTQGRARHRRSSSPRVVSTPPAPPRHSIPTVPLYVYEQGSPSETAAMNRAATSLLQELIMPTNNATVNSFMNLFGGGGMAPPPRFTDPVIVRPTAQQIATASTIEIVSVGDEVCAVCQDTMALNSEARRLNACSHRFHKTCIDTWLANNVVCPNCRHDIREA